MAYNKRSFWAKPYKVCMCMPCSDDCMSERSQVEKKKRQCRWRFQWEEWEREREKRRGRALYRRWLRTTSHCLQGRTAGSERGALRGFRRFLSVSFVVRVGLIKCVCSFFSTLPPPLPHTFCIFHIPYTIFHSFYAHTAHIRTGDGLSFAAWQSQWVENSLPYLTCHVAGLIRSLNRRQMCLYLQQRRAQIVV